MQCRILLLHENREDYLISHDSCLFIIVVSVKITVEVGNLGQNMINLQGVEVVEQKQHHKKPHVIHQFVVSVANNALV